MIQSTFHRRHVHAPDRIGIVGFHSQGFVIAKPAEAASHWLLERSQRLHERIDSYTNITAGLRVGIQMAERTPPGIYRRIWLLSDGEPNLETTLLWPTVQRARKAHININTIGFGDQYNRQLLMQIAQATHNGKFVPVDSLRELTNALVAHDQGTNGRYHHRSETTILVIDLSPSMREPMESKTKIKVVEEAVLHLLNFKAMVFN